jgi:hypothetical protein
MQNKFWIFTLCCFLLGCNNDIDSIHPIPLVMNVRLELSGVTPRYVEKYFVKPMMNVLQTTQHISNTHGVATMNGATLIIFFEDGVKFAEGEAIVQGVINSVKLPKKFTTVKITELCGDDLTDSNLMHIAKGKNIKPENILDNIVTVSHDLAANILPLEEYNAMFSNECDEPSKTPLYVLEN